MDVILVPMGLLCSILYHVWLWHKVRSQPLQTIIGINSAGRRLWAISMIKDNEKKNILAVQTMRNCIMGSTLMATTSILLCSGLAAIISSTYSVKRAVGDIVFGAHGELMLALKYVLLLLIFLFAFLCYSLSIRFLNQVNFLINIPFSDFDDDDDVGAASPVNAVKEKVVQMSGGSVGDVRIVVSPYRICPLGAHIDHQGGIVSAMTINKGIVLGFIPSDDGDVILQSGQFDGDVRFKVDASQQPKSSTLVQGNGASKSCNKELDWGCYAKGAVYALQRRGFHLTKGIIGFICGSDGLDSSGLSSSAAVGVAFLLALENANNLIVSQTDNIELDRLIENEYLGLRNGILDQSAVLLSKYGCLMHMNCKTKEHNLVHLSKMQGNKQLNSQGAYKILLAFSGLKHALANNPGYNSRVSECQEAARILLRASGAEEVEPFLCNVDPSTYEAHKASLEPNLAKRAKHYFSENLRVKEGLKAWASGDLETFGKLISASGLSSIENYECGCEPMIQLYKILIRAPGVYGARFSGAGFRGCCLALVDADHAEEAASFVKLEYPKVQPKLASQLKQDKLALICEAGDSAQIL